MRANILATGAAVLLFAFASCDDTTDTIGTSLINNTDNLEVKADTFTVTSRSIMPTAISSRSNIGYLGRVIDPETNTIVSCDYMVQFNALENFEMPSSDKIKSIEDGQITADSCEIHLQYYADEFYGDSLAQMKMTVYEMDTPMEEGVSYYSNYDPMLEGLIREGGLQQNRTYSLTDLTENDKERTSSSTKSIRIRLDKPYTDKEGNTYNNFGTYLLRKYYQNPQYFKNSYQFVHNVMPGFFIKITDGIGSMVYIHSSSLYVYFKLEENGTVSKANTAFAATEEVLQTSTITYDPLSIESLTNDNSCTYLKTPAGIFTELTLPVDEIMAGHANDTINSAKLVIPRINNQANTEYTLPAPTHLLMVPTDSLTAFFANNKVADNKSSFLTSNLNSNNTPTSNYTFSNISALLSLMAKNKKAGKSSENWNKVVLVPVTVTYSTNSNNTKVLTKVTHDMSLTSTRLAKGTSDTGSPLRLSVIYSKFYGR